MQTNVKTPLEIFGLPQRLNIPLFQRAYVWKEEDQWAPFWQDVRRLAEYRLAGNSLPATHFLGAVVVQADGAQLGAIPVTNVIDGQQRLTTLTILMDAIAAVAEEVGAEPVVLQLQSLTHNQSYVQGESSAPKLRHANRDRESFELVISAEPPIDYSTLPKSSIVDAHEYFVRAVRAWSDEGNDVPTARLEQLRLAVSQDVQLVVINLTAEENSQEIFETLNARGTALTAADLIKNFVFQRLAAEKVDTAQAYAERWPFDAKFWEKEVSVGRYLVSRSSLFFNQWLIARVGEEIGPLSTFTRFKAYVDREANATMADLLAVINKQAKLYEEWTLAAESPTAELNSVQRAVYRMRANGVEVLKPLLIWLHDPEASLPTTTIDATIAVAESWLTRRILLRLPSSDLGRVVADLIRITRDAPAADVAVRVEQYLRGLKVTSTYWPGDAEVRAALVDEPVYRRFSRGRVRMMLEAIEDEFRSETGQGQVARKGFPIEHVLPQRWEEHWPVAGLDGKQQRAEHVHRLGNLTLLTTALNSKVSNGAWTLKREAFKSHSPLLLTTRLLAASSGAEWDETQINERTRTLVETLLRIWPVPPGHLGEVVDPQDKVANGIDLRALVDSGFLEPGVELRPRSGQYGHLRAVVTDNALLDTAGATFDTPSGAARHLLGRASNGWYFWRLEDGRSLQDLRAALTSGLTAASPEA